MKNRYEILLVDDEEIVLRMLASFLQQFYGVHVAANAFEALQIVFGIHSDTFPLEANQIPQFLQNQRKQYQSDDAHSFTKIKPDLIIADIKMPRINGFQLIKILRHYFPSIPVIMITGYDAEGHSEDMKNLNIREVLLKPFSPIVLVDKINDMLQIITPN